ncbi:ornithine--oxo-acid transaminase [Kurthia massiliensis]|uniref:ornithine--oxo-acid transaminase n=1 Tax=Kurthia massiliensis TaxID=1033739 RepID=UPI00028892D4|nr:ornithine--oxo-acid transaminase [Kurthia massiliensis]
MKTTSIIATTNRLGAHNYEPLPIVIERAEGVWVYDVDGNRYLDMLSAYSALNQGHRHPKIIDALIAQSQKVTLTSRAFHNDQLAPFYEKLTAMTGKTKVLPMNTGAEAVESAIKIARRWAYDVKGVATDQAEIIGCLGNFHGRTMGALSLSSEAEYQRGFGPMLSGFKNVPYGDIEALEQAITPNTAAFIVEPIQGEAGIIIPPAGYLKAAAQLCQQHQVLLICDEIQTGLARTGKLFAYEWEDIVPDMLLLGKALGGGVMPISAVIANDDILGVLNPGSHGSTFGGNPLACAVAVAALDVIEQEQLANRSLALGDYLQQQLTTIQHSSIQQVRGKGLLIGIQLDRAARPFCEALMKQGVLCKETHDTVIRFAPPLTITREELDWAIEKIRLVFQEVHE